MKTEFKPDLGVNPTSPFNEIPPQKSGLLDRIGSVAATLLSPLIYTIQYILYFFSAKKSEKSDDKADQQISQLFEKGLRQKEQPVSKAAVEAPLNSKYLQNEISQIDKDITSNNDICDTLNDQIKQKEAEISTNIEKILQLDSDFLTYMENINSLSESINLASQKLKSVTTEISNMNNDPKREIIKPTPTVLSKIWSWNKGKSKDDSRKNDTQNSSTNSESKAASLKKQSEAISAREKLSNEISAAQLKMADYENKIQLIKDSTNPIKLEIANLEVEKKRAQATLKFNEKKIEELKAKRAELSPSTSAERSINIKQTVELENPVTSPIISANTISPPVSESKFATTRFLKECIETFGIPLPTDFNFDDGGVIPLESPIYIYLHDDKPNDRSCYIFGADIKGESTGAISYTVDKAGAISFSKGFTQYSVDQRKVPLYGFFITPVYSSLEKITSSENGQISFRAKIDLKSILKWHGYENYTWVAKSILSKLVSNLEDDPDNTGYVNFDTKALSLEKVTQKWGFHEKLKSLDEKFGN